MIASMISDQGSPVAWPSATAQEMIGPEVARPPTLSS
jgi:hypothetical protein